MNCEDVGALLGSFIDDELPVEVVARINGHIVDCLECQDERTTLMMVSSRVRDFRQQLDPPPGFVERLKHNVEARQRADSYALSYRNSSYMVPFAATAAVFVFVLLPHGADKITSTRTVTNEHRTLLSAQDLYSYERDMQKSNLRPIEFDPSLTARIIGFVAQAPQFPGWRLVTTSVVTVNTTKAIKYSYSHIDHGNIKSMVCYEFRGGVFDAAELSHHVIDGRSICCGTKDNVSLVYWRNSNKDFVLASDLPRADLLSIALDS
jgi:hypothetical protein